MVPLHIPLLAALVVDSGSGMLVLLFLLVMLLFAAFLSVVARPEFGRFGPEGQSSSLVRSSSALARACPRHVLLRAVFPVVADRPRCPAQWPLWTTRTRTQLVGFSLRPFASCSHLFSLVLPEEYSTWFILGDDLRIRRIPRFLVRQWILVTDSLWIFGSVSVFSAMLGPQWYMLCVSHGVCLLVTMHLALCSFLSSSGHRCLSS